MPLHVYQSLWGMEQLPYGRARKWTLVEQLDMILDAGYDGVSVSFSDADAARVTAREAADRGLRLEASCFPTTIDELKPILETIDAVGRDHVDHINLQPNVRPATLGEAIPYVLGWQEIAQDASIPTYFETHRDRMTTDLLFTLQLIDAVPSMQLTADLSHYLVGREFALPIADSEHELIDRILRRAAAFHGRVASREQVQIQISFPHHDLWLELFARWWKEGLRHFRHREGPEATVTFTTELGPPYWYAITGPDGEELSDRWLEALQMQQLVRGLWSEVSGEGTP